MADKMSYEAAAFAADGTPRARVELPTQVFDGTVNMPVMHQVVKAYLANQRQGNASTKTRKTVIGGNQKPWRQKGTGRARQGSTRAPNWVGGGTVFGPQPRGYTQDLPRKVRQLGRKSALNARAREDAILIVDALTIDTPKTATIRALLGTLGVAERKVLILTDGLKPTVHRSARNLPNVHVMPYGDVSTYHVLWSDVVVIESGALGASESTHAEAEPVEATTTAAPAKRARAPRKTASKTPKTSAEPTATQTTSGDATAPAEEK